MSTALYRWGRWTSAHPWRVLLASLPQDFCEQSCGVQLETDVI